MRNKSIEFYCLTEQFYKKYNKCVEILYKPKRPYIVHLVEYKGLTFAIPVRSNIKHKFSYITMNEDGKNKGLDFTKAVIITDFNYISKYQVKINQIEYLKLDKNRKYIEKKMLSYVKTYKKALTRLDILRNKEIVQKSALQYFHTELEIK